MWSNKRSVNHESHNLNLSCTKSKFQGPSLLVSKKAAVNSRQTAPHIGLIKTNNEIEWNKTYPQGSWRKLKPQYRNTLVYFSIIIKTLLCEMKFKLTKLINVKIVSFSSHYVWFIMHTSLSMFYTTLKMTSWFRRILNIPDPCHLISIPVTSVVIITNPTGRPAEQQESSVLPGCRRTLEH
jgi:hypothetical protein